MDVVTFMFYLKKNQKQKRNPLSYYSFFDYLLLAQFASDFLNC